MTHPSHGQKGKKDSLKNQTYTHDKGEGETEELPLSWNLKKVDMRFYGKADDEHDHDSPEDIQEIHVAHDESGKKYTLKQDPDSEDPDDGIIEIETV